MGRRLRVDGPRSRPAQHPRPRGRSPAAVPQPCGQRSDRPLDPRLPDAATVLRLPARRTSPTTATSWAPTNRIPTSIRGYPISKASWRRKLRRDATGESAYKNIKVLVAAARKRAPEGLQILGVQVVLAGVAVAAQRPLAYVVWLGSWCTLWKVSNRLRAIAEHGGMERAADRRHTTHVIHQSWIARLCIVPYNTGWHLAHHVDMGVPWRNLPRFHAELVGRRLGHRRRRISVVPGLLASLLGRLTSRSGRRSIRWSMSGRPSSPRPDAARQSARARVGRWLAL